MAKHEFKKGNKYWQLADPDNIGRPPKFKTPKDLLIEAFKYFEWIDENPITIFKKTITDKTSYSNEEIRQKPYTWDGLYVYLNVCNLEHYKSKSEFSKVITHIDKIIRTQKFEGASVNIFNANIIARDLGLVDKQENKTDIAFTSLTLEEKEARIKELIKKSGIKVE